MRGGRVAENYLAARHISSHRARRGLGYGGRKSRYRSRSDVVRGYRQSCRREGGSPRGRRWRLREDSRNNDELHKNFSAARSSVRTVWRKSLKHCENF